MPPYVLLPISSLEIVTSNGEPKMTDLLGRFFGSSSSKQDRIPVSKSLTIRTNPYHPSQFLVHPPGYPIDVLPMYTIKTSDYSKPNVMMFGSGGNPNDPCSRIGDATYHTFSSTTDMTLRGQSMKLKVSQLSGNFTLSAPGMGPLKWHVSQLGGSKMELKDGSGNMIATFRSSGFPGTGEKKLEIYVPIDMAFMDLVLLSAIVARKATKDEEKLALEVAGASAG